MKHYPTSFLEKLYEHKVRVLHSRVTLLDYDERVMGRIDGIIMNGTLNADGNSAVRRNMSLTLSVKDREDKKVFSYIDLSKKVHVEVGLENFTDEFLEEKIIWFNMGTYVLLDPSFSHDVSSLTMSLQAQDKMALMNGTLGGVFTEPVSFIEKGLDGTKKSLTWRDILQNTTSLIGSEDPGRVVINDVPDYIYNYVQVKTVDGLYEDFIHESTPENDAMGNPIVGERIITKAWDGTSNTEDIKFSQGERLYQLKRFAPADPIQSDSSTSDVMVKNAGETYLSLYDEIISELGDIHEVFYDRDSNFIFQKVQNFINDTFVPENHPEMDYQSYELDMQSYKPDYTNFPFVYDFSNKESIVSVTNNPSWTNVKNDFTLIGKNAGNTLQIAIDKKPSVIEIREWFKRLQREYEGNIQSGDLKFLRMDNDFTRIIYREDVDTVPFLFKEATSLNPAEYIDVPLSKIPWQIAHGLKTFFIKGISSSLGYNIQTIPRWGQECERMIFKYVKNITGNGLIPNSGIFNVENIGLGEPWLAGFPIELAADGVDEVETLNYTTPFFSRSGDPAHWAYYLDLIDEDSELGRFSIDKIGRRPKVTTSDKPTTLFRTSPRNLVVMTEDFLTSLGGDRVLRDLEMAGQPYAVIKSKLPQYFRRAEFDSEEDRSMYPWKDILGDPLERENQYLPDSFGNQNPIGGMFNGISFEMNKDNLDPKEERLGWISITQGSYYNPFTGATYENEILFEETGKNTIQTPFANPVNEDANAFICFIKNKSLRLLNSTSTDNLFTVVKESEGKYYHSVYANGLPVWEEFSYDRTSDVIVAVIFQDHEIFEEAPPGEDEEPRPPGEGFSHEISNVYLLENILGAEIVSLFSENGSMDCFTLLRADLYRHTNFAEVVTINCMPIYHLEPNTLVRIQDEWSDVSGVYMITSYSLPLSPTGGTMSLSAIKVYQQI